MRRFLSVLVLTIFGLVLAHAQGFSIDDYDVKIKQKPDGTMDVTESIGVTFSDWKHGIFRDIPIYLQDGRGNTRQYLIYDVSVTDGTGTPLTKVVSRKNINLDIKIGDKDVTFPPDTKITYVIKYKVFGQMNWPHTEDGWPSSSELYWNLIGTEWQALIHHVTWDIEFPTVPSANSLRAKIFWGPYGSKDSIALNNPGNAANESGTVSMNLTNGRLTGECDEFLSTGDAVSVVLGMPADLIKKPSQMQQFQMFILPNLGYGIFLFPLLLMPILWAMYGKDPRKLPMTVQFEPPAGLSSAVAGSFIDERVDDRDISSIFIALAVKGYIKFDGIGPKGGMEDAVITCFENPGGPEIDGVEAEVLQSLQKIGGEISMSDLRTDIAPKIFSLKNKCFEELVNRGYYHRSPTQVKGTVGCIGFPAMAGLAFMAIMASPYHDVLPAAVGGILGYIIILIFGQLMPRRTNEGAKAHALVRGFYEFIARAKQKELNYMSQREPDQALFEEYLPYAAAFGLTDQWVMAFEGYNLQTPGWYGGGGPLNNYLFLNSFNTMQHSIASAATTPPRSSGSSGGYSGFSSGGGFSGGGGGGGGGGSW